MASPLFCLLRTHRKPGTAPKVPSPVTAPQFWSVGFHVIESGSPGRGSLVPREHIQNLGLHSKGRATGTAEGLGVSKGKREIRDASCVVGSAVRIVEVSCIEVGGLGGGWVLGSDGWREIETSVLDS